MILRNLEKYVEINIMINAELKRTLLITVVLSTYEAVGLSILCRFFTKSN